MTVNERDRTKAPPPNSSDALWISTARSLRHAVSSVRRKWEEGEVEKPKSTTSGPRVNKEGNVVYKDRKITGKLTSGEIFAGKETGNNGNAIDGDGNAIDESHEEKEKRELSDKDKKLAQQIAYCLTQVLDKIKLICDLIAKPRYYLADLLKEITGTVTSITTDAESKIEGMPRAKTDLNSLWGQLKEPLFQIIAAVGLLLQSMLEQ
ncbi:hypothetical protein EHS25_005741 [Saitozyma podzolica]|uniref:DUF6987 domain-containing protein n=1 Tax=Saitozyma podzolica TaxID=1890683 RepID=A0A427XW94_9TREE|nr:hypothetical protein EHS25_005741 [Saitozyma podzolica]